jgi:hypothetical protein
LEIFPINYSAIGIYSSSSASLYGGTTPNQIGGWGADYQSDTAQIQINGTDAVDLKGDNKKYLVFGHSYWVGFTGTSTQRVIKLFADDTPLSMAYFNWESSTSDVMGQTTTDIVETAAATVDLDLRMYTGDGVLADEGGADSDGTAPTSTVEHIMVVIELKDGCDVFKSHDPTGLQACATAGPIDIDVCDTVDFNDAASFTKADANGMNATIAMDCFAGANIAIPRGAVGSSQTWSAEANLTVGGVEEFRSRHGNFQEGESGADDRFGFVANPLGVVTLAQDEDLGVSVTEYTGSSGGGGDCETTPFASDEGITFWGINLDTMDNEGAIIPQIMHHRRLMEIS